MKLTGHFKTGFPISIQGAYHCTIAVSIDWVSISQYSVMLRDIGENISSSSDRLLYYAYPLWHEYGTQ